VAPNESSSKSEMNGTSGFTPVTIIYTDSPAENHTFGPRQRIFNDSKAMCYTCEGKKRPVNTE